MPLPTLAITMGDPAGVGPELCWRSLDVEVLERCRVILVGSPSILEAARLRFAPTLSSPPLSGDEPQWSGVRIHEVEDLPMAEVPIGRVDGTCGKRALAAIAAATDLCRQGRADAMVTAPVSKEAIEAGGTPFVGHTEFISQRCGDHDEMMMMSDWREKLHVGYATTHLPLGQVASAITPGLLERRCRQSLSFLNSVGLESLAVCGLNPHAGEGGVLGTEEARVIEPTLERLRDEGLPVHGPFPADTLFVASIRRRYDGILALYHDQGGIPFKMLAFENGVNHTLGLPIVRTSVDHGTAWDIAWQGKASTGSLQAAVDLALRRVDGNWKEPPLDHNAPPQP